jgi:hypothetical protein
MNIDKIIEGYSLVKKGIGILDGGDLDFYIRRLTDNYKFLLTLAPHQIGDRVMLAETPEITPTQRWGWMGAKHFLVKGAKATVKEVEADGREFGYMLEFDDDSWIDSGNEVHLSPPGSRGAYCFAPKFVTAVSER